MKDPNPYSPPADVEASEFAESRLFGTWLPPELLIPTKLALQFYGLYQFLFPLVFGALTGGWTIDVVALLILSTGLQMNRSTFRRFPKTIFLCGLYLLLYGVSFIDILRAGVVASLAQATGWELFLGLLRTVSMFAACYCIHMMLRCYRFHRASVNDRSTQMDD